MAYCLPLFLVTGKRHKKSFGTYFTSYIHIFCSPYWGFPHGTTLGIRIQRPFCTHTASIREIQFSSGLDARSRRVVWSSRETTLSPNRGFGSNVWFQSPCEETHCPFYTTLPLPSLPKFAKIAKSSCMVSLLSPFVDLLSRKF